MQQQRARTRGDSAQHTQSRSDNSHDRFSNSLSLSFSLPFRARVLPTARLFPCRSSSLSLLSARARFDFSSSSFRAPPLSSGSSRSFWPLTRLTARTQPNVYTRRRSGTAAAAAAVHISQTTSVSADALTASAPPHAPSCFCFCNASPPPTSHLFSMPSIHEHKDAR
jgi:hypothetical protein